MHPAVPATVTTVSRTTTAAPAVPATRHTPSVAFAAAPLRRASCGEAAASGETVHARPNPSSGHRLKLLTITGGFLDGTALQPADGLNCIIGARGTGKTTVLELIRFVLDAGRGAETDAATRRRLDALINENLDGGRVELTLETKDGLTYIVTRAVGEEPIVLDTDRQPREIHLKTGGLPGVDLFSQNEIESIADQALLQLGLLDRFEGEAIGVVTAELRSLRQALDANAGQILPLQAQIATLTEDLSALPSLEEKLKGYTCAGTPDAAVINEAHTLKSLRDREKRALEAARRFLTEHGAHFTASAGQVATSSETLFGQDVVNGQNAETITTIRDTLVECRKEVHAALVWCRHRTDAALAAIDATAQTLQVRHHAQELAFRSLIERHQVAQGQATERARLERARNELLAKHRTREELTCRLEALGARRTEMLTCLSELRDRRFAIRRRVAEMITQKLEGTIRVSVQQAGDLRPYIELLADALRNARLKNHAAAAKLTRALWPDQLSEIVRAGDPQPLIDDADLSEDQARKVIESLATSEALFKLETVELGDLPRVELNDGGEYKPSVSLSTGQKCTTILPILLLDSERPLLIDQPEDNLDNRFIFECVVGSIRTVKARRQLLFVTHNPNIPVLADAERVFVLESDGRRARLATQGTVDECKTEILTLLEGGAEAFALRQRRYGGQP